MDANWSNIGEPDKPHNNTRTFGMVILGLGVALAGWVVTIIYRLITGDGSIEIISNLIPMESIEVTIEASSEGMIVPDSFFYVVGLFLCVLLLAICGGIAKVLIANGVKMLQPDVQGSLEHLRKDLLEQFNKGNR
ncbi:MAG: hypothetical protein JSU60_00275 [Nitrospirota bacterium]|nr:MAG: hypothetical protein JSU60_00275 [Nitrospirota bacterium]